MKLTGENCQYRTVAHILLSEMKVLKYICGPHAFSGLKSIALGLKMLKTIALLDTNYHFIATLAAIQCSSE
jgi:hypothetical protein